MDEPKEKWSMAYDGGSGYGIMTTNNAVLLGARSLPITAVVQLIFYRCVSYFRELGEIVLRNKELGIKYGNKFCASVKNRVGHNNHNVIEF